MRRIPAAIHRRIACVTACMITTLKLTRKQVMYSPCEEIFLFSVCVLLSRTFPTYFLSITLSYALYWRQRLQVMSESLPLPPCATSGGKVPHVALEKWRCCASCVSRWGRRITGKRQGRERNSYLINLPAHAKSRRGVCQWVCTYAALRTVQNKNWHWTSPSICKKQSKLAFQAVNGMHGKCWRKVLALLNHVQLFIN